MNITDVSRYEFKYLVNADQAPQLRRFLSQYCSADTNAQSKEWYGIQSLYFDTPDFAFYRASVGKAVERLKLRARTYATFTGPVKLEIKRRVGDVVWKRSFLTTHDVWDGLDRDGASGLARTHSPSRPFVQLVEEMRAAPKVLVTYERHALYSNLDDYVRVTFDRRICSQRMHRWSLTGDPRRWLAVDGALTAGEDESMYVLELKFKVAPPAWLRDMVTRFGLVRRGFSKYSRSVTRIRSDRDSAWDLRSCAAMPSKVWRVA